MDEDKEIARPHALDGDIVSGIYTTRGEAEAVCNALVEACLTRAYRRHIADRQEQAAGPDEPQKLETDDTVLKYIAIDGRIGRVVGTGLGALVEVALVAANITLFLASPLMAPLAVLGRGAAVGGLVGAAVGAEKTTEKLRDGKVSDLVLDAIRNGYFIVVANTRTDEGSVHRPPHHRRLARAVNVTALFAVRRRSGSSGCARGLA